MADFYFDEVYTLGAKQLSKTIRKKAKEYSLLTKLFFGNVGTISKEELIIVKVLVDSNAVATQSKRYTEGDTNKEDGVYKFLSLYAPYFHNWKDIDPNMLNQITRDEDPARPFTPEQRAMSLAAEKLEELRAGQGRSLEMQAFELLSTGKIFVEGHGKQDFGLPSNIFNDATSDKIANDPKGTIHWLSKYAKIAKDTGVNGVDSIVVSKDVFDVIYDDSAVKATLDNRRINGNDFSFTGEDSRGSVFYGHLSLPGIGMVALYGYDPVVHTNKLFPAGSVLFGSEGMGSINYGAVLRDGGIAGLDIPTAGMDAEFVYKTTNAIPRTIRVDRQTSPLCSPNQLGGWCYVKNAV